MKTPEEIKRGLKCAIKGCMEPESCEACPYYIKDGDVMCCTSDIISDSIAYIEELEAKQPTWISVDDIVKHWNRRDGNER